jgi:hypothetical protein
MEREYIKTFEQYIAEEGDAPEEITGDSKEKELDTDKTSPDYSEIAPTAKQIMVILNKAGFEIDQTDILKWDGSHDENAEGELLVHIDNDDKYFVIDNGLLYYQIGNENVILGQLKNTDALVIAIKDYFNIKDAEEKKKDDENSKDNDSGNDAENAADNATAAAAEDDLDL